MDYNQFILRMKDIYPEENKNAIKKPKDKKEKKEDNKETI